MTTKEAKAMKETINTLRGMDMMRLIPVIRELQELIKYHEWMIKALKESTK